MNEPIVYVTQFQIAGGRSEDYRRFYAELVRIVEENEPRTSAFLAFANEDLTEFTNVHVFSDRDALDHHMAVLRERMGLLPGDLSTVTRHLQPVRVDVFGVTGGAAAEMDKGLAESGVPFGVKQRFLGGFTRAAVER